MAAIKSVKYFGSFVNPLIGAQGINAGDPFSGTFSYDTSAAPISASSVTATYQPISFNVTLPNGMLVANHISMRMSTDPQDPSIEIFGELPFNLFMGLLLRGPSGVIQNTNLPIHIVLSKFLIKHFTISDMKAVPFGYDQTPVPPLAAQVFMRGELNALNQVSCLLILAGLLRGKYSIHRRREIGA